MPRVHGACGYPSIRRFLRADRARILTRRSAGCAGGVGIPLRSGRPPPPAARGDAGSVGARISTRRLAASERRALAAVSAACRAIRAGRLLGLVDASSSTSSDFDVCRRTAPDRAASSSSAASMARPRPLARRVGSPVPASSAARACLAARSARRFSRQCSTGAGGGIGVATICAQSNVTSGILRFERAPDVSVERLAADLDAGRRAKPVEDARPRLAASVRRVDR